MNIRGVIAIGLVIGCSSDPSPLQTGAPLRGELASYVVNRGATSEVVHRLRLPDGSTRDLLFSEPGAIEARPGSALAVWGDDEGQALRVRRHVVEAPPAPAPLPLIAGAKKPTRRWAFVLVDVDGGGNPINKANAQDVLFNPNRPDSIRSYFREVSYGVQDLEGQVMGPLPYAMNGRCDTDELAKQLLPMVGSGYDQYLWFFGSLQSACDWAGIAELGRAERPTRHSWYNSFHSCTILVQEPGHNFGMVHSSAIRCTLDGAPVPMAWPEQGEAVTCSNVEYGNPFDPMGGGDCHHMNGVQKAYQDWLSGCNVIKATESGTFTIYPLASACDGPQLLHVPFPKPRTFGRAGVLTGYYLELRAPVGYRDRTLAPQVLVMLANDVREARQTGNRNWIVDMTPGTATARDAALPVGQRYEDTLAGGPKFTVLSADASKAVIKVELSTSMADPAGPGAAICSDLKQWQPTSSTACVTPPTPAAPMPDGGAPLDAGAPDAVDAGTPGEMDGNAPAPGTGGSTGSGGSATAPRPAAPPAENLRAQPGSGCAIAGQASGGLPLLVVLFMLGRRRWRTR